ncbi:MAG: hypothetical protein KC656_14350 [Myxococcales bacterium]|nr:hypothetical protein [Myxococcales bacterium]
MRGAWLLLLAGCSAESSLAELPPSPIPPDETIEGSDLTLVAWPGQGSLPDGSTRALPAQRVGIDFTQLQVLDLLVPFELDGTVTGRRAQAVERVALPGVEGPAEATLHFEHPDAVERWRVGTDGTGAFAVDLVEGGHTVTVVPDDAALPFLRFERDLQDAGFGLDVRLEDGAPVWGRVLRGGAPRAGAAVRLVTEDGIRGPTTTTDADGWYTLQAAEGMQLRVETSGSDDGIEPVVSSGLVDLTRLGERVDLATPPVLTYTLSARIIGPNGVALRQVPYRLGSNRLDGYPGGTVEQTGYADNNGNIVTQVVSGTYTLEILVQTEGIAGRAIPVEIVGAPAPLGSIQLDGPVEVPGQVVDANGIGVAGVRVSCTEPGLARRGWAVDTDSTGAFVMAVPREDLRCVALPSGSRAADLAARRFEVYRSDLPVLGTADPVSVQLPAGRLVEGEVRFAGSPEAYALVEVRGPDGELLATDLTAEDGSFAMRVQP